MAECSEFHKQSAVNCDTCEEDTAEHLCETCYDRLCTRCKKIHNNAVSLTNGDTESRDNAVSLTNDVRKEIQSHVVRVKSKLDSQMVKLLGDLEDNKKMALCNLESHESARDEYIKNTETFITGHENESPQEKVEFILFGNHALHSTMPGRFTEFAFPGLVKYESDIVDEVSLKHLCGRLTDENILRPTRALKTSETISIESRHEGKIMSLAYQCLDDTFWLFSGRKYLKIDRSTNLILEVDTNCARYKYRPVTVTKKGHVIYREDQCTLNKMSDFDLPYNFAFHVSPNLAPLCLGARKADGVIVGFLDIRGTDGGFLWLTEDGFIEKEIRYPQAWNKVYSHDLKGKHQPAYIAENVNGDICFSNKTVDVYTSNLEHRFCYKGSGFPQSEIFRSYGICTNQHGHILIADRCSRGVHILSKDGDLLMLMNIPGLNEGYPISLTIDKNCSLCVGCSDGRIRVVEYLKM